MSSDDSITGRPDDPRRLLRRFELKPKDHHGQNFLTNPGVARKIARLAVDRQPMDVVEVAAGMGHLTFALAERAREVVALELDPDMIRVLESVTCELPNVTVVHGDAVKTDYAHITDGLVGPLTVVGNLPFHRSTDILFALLDRLQAAQRMVLMFQREVAQRLTASPGTKTYGKLTVTTAVRARVKHCFHVKPGSFHPPPQVQATVIEIVPRKNSLVDPCCNSVLMRILEAAFGQRRKTLRNALKARGLWEAVETIDFRSMALEPAMRAEQMSVVQYTRLAQFVCGQSGQCIRHGRMG